MKLKVCPKCGSTNIDYKPTVLESSLGSALHTHRCNNCGYESKLFLEIDEKNFKENKKSQIKKYKFLEHTADVKFQARGDTLEQAFKNSALAFQETMTQGEKIKSKASKKISLSVKSRGIEGLLVDFLQEFLYLFDSESFVLSKIKKLKIKELLKGYELYSEVSGDYLENTDKGTNYKFTNNIKAITLNDLFVKKDKKTDKWICQVVLDV